MNDEKMHKDHKALLLEFIWRRLSTILPQLKMETDEYGTVLYDTGTTKRVAGLDFWHTMVDELGNELDKRLEEL
jgi:glycyl-tRNA synthetase beta subunit